jgi:hypothetical protein
MISSLPPSRPPERSESEAPERPPSAPPKRPKLEADLGFERQVFVRWFDPMELFRAGAQALLSSLFGSFADKRELQAALNSPQPGRLHQYADRATPFWFDYVADIGDGFDATYSIAWLLAQPSLRLEGEPELTERGHILLMGGDEVYPSASRAAYQNRSVGPYRAAFPYTPDEANAPHLYALPGNHDWYDGLSAFLRQFAQHDQRWVGAWRTQQRRSYFARELPGNYWLWGVDIQLHADIDSPQLLYFHESARALKPGDRVILATAEPSWVKEAEGDHAGYQSLLLLMREVEDHQARVVLVLTGDSHHYAHYEDAKGPPNEHTHFITAGGGGAFLHGTHTLPPSIGVPASTDPARQNERRELTRGKIFPVAAESRRLIRANIGKFPLTNWQFLLLWVVPWLWLALLLVTDGDLNGEGIVARLAGSLSGSAIANRTWLLVSLVVTFSVGAIGRMVFATHPAEQKPADGKQPPLNWRKAVDVCMWFALGFALVGIATAGVGQPSWLVYADSPAHVLFESLARNLSAWGLVLALPSASAAYVCRPHRWEWDLAGRVLCGWLHGALYVVSWLIVAVLVAKLALLSSWLGTWFWVVVTPLLAAVSSSWLFAGCLWFTGQYQRALLNDAFSAIGIEDYKNFLRLRIDPNGALTVFCVGLEHISRGWRVQEEGGPSDPYLVTDTPPRPHLIEKFQIAP